MSIRLDGNDKGRMFEGIGGVFSNGMTKLLQDYPAAQQEDILRYLFEDHFGAGLQHIKVEIGSDVNTSSGTVPSHMRSHDDYDIKRGAELWIAGLAKQINPAITLEALRWGTPAWIRNDEDKYLYYLNFLKGAEREFGLRFDYLGCDQNEGCFDRDWVVNTLAPGLKRDGFGYIRLVAADSDSGWQIAEQALKDRELDEACAVFNSHYTVKSSETAMAGQKPLWAGEHLAGMRHDFVKGALTAAYHMLAMYPLGRMTMYEMHPALEASYPSTPFNFKGMIAASWPWSGHYEVTAGLWAAAHFTQFVKPGWKYLDGGCLAGDDGSQQESYGYVTLKAPDGGDWSMIAVNASGIERTYRYELTGGLKGECIHVWKTDEADSFVQESDILPEDGCFTFTTAPYTMYSLTTTTGQRKGIPGTDIPQEKRMMLPWRDNFATCEKGRQPWFFNDQGGAFEICHKGRESTAVLCQRITNETKPIDWVYRTTPLPYTLIGSELWTDYTVEAQVCLPEAESFGYVAGRCVNNGKFDDYPYAYRLCLTGTGKWMLCRQEEELLSGQCSCLDLNVCHRLSLKLAGDRLFAYVDGVLAGETKDDHISAGQAALGSSYHEVCFANLKIDSDGKDSCIRYPELDPRLKWDGEWKRKDGDYADYGRRQRYAQTEGSTLDLCFDGTGVCITGSRDRDGGRVQICVDDLPVQMSDCYSETGNDRKTGLSIPRSRSAVAAVYGLEPGIHSVRLVVDGSRNTASMGTRIAIDAVEISGGLGLLESSPTGWR